MRFGDIEAAGSAIGRGVSYWRHSGEPCGELTRVDREDSVLGRARSGSAHASFLRGSDTCVCLATITTAVARLATVAALLDLAAVGALHEIEMSDNCTVGYKFRTYSQSHATSAALTHYSQLKWMRLII